jgi:integrase/recombinase XerC
MVPAADVLESFFRGRRRTTWAAYQADLKDFAKFLNVSTGEAAAEELVNCDHGNANRVAMAYRAAMTERGLSAATIARRLATLRSMVRVARQIGRISWTLDVESPKSQPYRDTRGPGRDGLKKILAEARRRATTPEGKRNLALIRLLHDLGLRRGECVAMDLGDVDLDGGTVSIIGKGRTEPITLTLSRPATEALRHWLEVRGDQPGPLFVRCDRAAGDELGRLTGHSVCKVVHALGRAAGLTREVRPHGLRHLAVTTVLDLSGGNVREARRFSRHSKLETLALYDDNRDDVAGKWARMLGEDSE